MFSDLRFAFRSLRKSPGFTVIAVLTLALGIGANTAIFTLVNAVLLRPLPFRAPDELVMLWHSYPDVGLMQASVSAPNYVDYTKETDVFTNVMAFTGGNLTLGGDGAPFRVQQFRVTPNAFDLFGVMPMMGRPFSAAEGDPGNGRVTVLSHTFWQNHFGGDPEILDRELILDDEVYEVVGVMPPEFRFGRNTDLYLPLSFTPAQLGDDRRGNENLSVVGRVRSDVTIEQAQAHMSAVARRIDEAYGRGGYQITLQPLRDQLLGQRTRPALLVLLGAVGFVLLIGCANVANLLYARAERRQREIAVRIALGAGRGRIIRQFLTESVLLSGIGGVAGLLLRPVMRYRIARGESAPRTGKLDRAHDMFRSTSPRPRWRGRPGAQSRPRVRISVSRAAMVDMAANS